jgi:hypothetical protein
VIAANLDNLRYSSFIPQRNANGTLGNQMKLNETTRTYPRTMQEAYPNTVSAIESRQRWEWLEGHRSDESAQAEFWVYIACAFAAGFVVAQLWG